MNIVISLVKKDFYTLSKSARSLALFMLAYGAIMLMTGNLSFLFSFTAVLCMTLPLSSFSYDDFTKWNSYALTMPISRRALALSKYVLLLLTIFASGVVGLLFWAISFLPIVTAETTPLPEMLIIWEAVSVMVLIAHSLTIPLIIRYGAERGRSIFVSLCICAFLLFALVGKYFAESIAASIDIESTLKLFSVIAPFITALALFLSYRTSVALLEKKEF